jgi:hypothetical protein
MGIIARVAMAKSTYRTKSAKRKFSKIAGVRLVEPRIISFRLAPPVSLLTCVKPTFTMQHQQQTEWCWAANATTVALFYNPASSWTQCTLVNAEFGRNDCCTNPASASCNQPWYLDRALTKVGHLARAFAGPTGVGDIVNQFAQNRPLGVEITWSGGGGHAPALTCYWRIIHTAFLVHVEDPWYGPSLYQYKAFCTSYQGSGSWSYSYMTQP